jgi:ribA/ribD-fused uncharacterized protein
MNATSAARDVQALCAGIAQGIEPRFLFFWGHRVPKDGSVTKSCFSQWYETPFTASGEHYRTAEHFMMAEKARIFDDEPIRKRILESRTPGEAKKLGRQIAGFDEAVWLRERFQVVVAANMAKFTQNAELREFLLQTGDRVLVEASPVDRIWGIGLAADHEDAARPARWPGLNLLGFALMEVRARLAGS